jgi:hypothetical protein
MRPVRAYLPGEPAPACRFRIPRGADGKPWQDHSWPLANHRSVRRKHGGGRIRIDMDNLEVTAPEKAEEPLALDEALGQLATTDPQAAELVKLRYFAGYTVQQAAAILGISPRSADFLWAYARTWLFQKVQGGEAASTPQDPNKPEET